MRGSDYSAAPQRDEQTLSAGTLANIEVCPVESERARHDETFAGSTGVPQSRRQRVANGKVCSSAAPSSCVIFPRDSLVTEMVLYLRGPRHPLLISIFESMYLVSRPRLLVELS